MSLTKKYADIVLVAEDMTTIDTGITSALTVAEAFPSEEASTVKRLAKIGLKSASFAREALDLGTLHEGLLPRNLDLAKMERTIDNRDAIRTHYNKVRQLLEKLEAALVLLGVDAYRDGLDIYNSLKRHGTDQTLQSAVAELGRIFRKSQQEEDEPEIPAEPPVTPAALREPVFVAGNN